MRVREAATGTVKLEIEATREEINLLMDALDTSQGGRKPKEHKDALDCLRQQIGIAVNGHDPNQNMPAEG